MSKILRKTLVLMSNSAPSGIVFFFFFQEIFAGSQQMISGG